MATTNEARMIAGFERFAEALTLARAPGHQRRLDAVARCVRAATFARMAEACDQLVAAALAHDFAGVIGRHVDGLDRAAKSAEFLDGVFSSRLLSGLRCVARFARDGYAEGDLPALAAANRSATARLERYNSAGEDAGRNVGLWLGCELTRPATG